MNHLLALRPATCWAVVSFLHLCLGAPLSAQGLNLVSNPGFEVHTQPVPSPGWLTLGVGSTVVSGWVVTAGTIDLVTLWNQRDGRVVVDLDGTSPGSIAQDFSTIPGRDYSLCFDLGTNWNRPVSSAVVRVAGQQLALTVDGTGWTEMHWQRRHLRFTAGATTTRIEFASTNGPSVSGIVIDNVSVEEDPQATCVCAQIGHRNGNGNTDAFRLRVLPRLGSAVQYTVGSATGAALFLLVGSQPAAVAFLGGELLMDPGSIAFVLPTTSPGSLDIPVDAHLLGWTLPLQAASIRNDQVRLYNAQDILIGQ